MDASLSINGRLHSLSLTKWLLDRLLARRVWQQVLRPLKLSERTEPTVITHPHHVG